MPSGAALVDPRAAIWTGWIEPAASRQHTFCKQQPGTTSACASDPRAGQPGGQDRYRIWVNGTLRRRQLGRHRSRPCRARSRCRRRPRAGAAPAARRALPGARRVPAARRAARRFGDGAARGPSTARRRAPVPTASLYPMAQANGNGLQGTFFPGRHGRQASPDDGRRPSAHRRRRRPHLDAPRRRARPLGRERLRGAVRGAGRAADLGRLHASAPTPTARCASPSTAASSPTPPAGPPGLEPETCAHDICGTGAAISRTCKQGNFCAGLICLPDPACCSITWDARCVAGGEERLRHRVHARPADRDPAAGRLAVRHPGRVRHAGGQPSQIVRAAKLRLMWALAGTAARGDPGRAAVRGAWTATSRAGTGLNAAYFSDAGVRDGVPEPHRGGRRLPRRPSARAGALTTGHRLRGAGAPAARGGRRARPRRRSAPRG